MIQNIIHNSFENRNGTLYFGGTNTIDLCDQYGTPLYVYDQNRIEQNIDRLKSALIKNYPKSELFYAIKSNNNPDILKIIAKKTDGFDASYSTEIQLAKIAGTKKNHISYSGNYASKEELKFGLKNAGIIMFDSISAFEKTLSFGIPKKMAFRINPKIGKGSFDALIFAGKNAKFGIPHEQTIEAYRKAQKAGVKSFGIYMMTGSNVLDEKYFEIITEKLTDIAANIKKHLNIRFEFINIGGGFGIPYKPEEKALNIEKIIKKVASIIKIKEKKYDLGNPTLILEPGRYIVGDAGILLTKIHDIKQSYKKFVGVDAGMNTLLRPALYGAYHHILLTNRLNEKKEEKVNICGQICENADIIAKERLLPNLKENDLLAILCTGAYGFGMSSNYNTRPRPAEILIKNETHKLIRKRENLLNPSQI